jgi:glycosyltransferase involved in cell wall biosynthesis
MKIAFDLRRMSNPGIGRYMKCLVEAILASSAPHQYLLIMSGAGENLVDTRDNRVEVVTSPAKYYSMREQVELPRILRRYSVDLFHSPHFLLPFYSPCPTVVTIHDVIYLACRRDLPTRIGRLYYRMMMVAAVRLAKRIITDSEFSKQDIVRHLRVDPSKIEVIYPGVDRNFVGRHDSCSLSAIRLKHGLQSEYILYSGIYKPRKNHAGLLRAFREFLTLGGDADLVIAGPMTEGELPLRHLADGLNISHRLKLTGFVNDEELRALYSGARVYACPSLYEGFGFTVLEAMACGTPVVCSPETSLPEVAGAAAIYSNARNPKDFGGALHRVFTDNAVREQLIDKGLENVKRFAWKRAAAETLDVYELAQRSVLRSIRVPVH